METAQPEISSMVSALVLLVESADKNAAFWVGVVSPFMISFMTVFASSKDRSCFVTILMMASLIIMLLLSDHSFITQLLSEDRVLRDMEEAICCANIPWMMSRTVSNENASPPSGICAMMIQDPLAILSR